MLGVGVSHPVHTGRWVTLPGELGFSHAGGRQPRCAVPAGWAG